MSITFNSFFKCKFGTKLQQYRKLDLPSGIINKFESKIHLDTRVTQKMQHENDTPSVLVKKRGLIEYGAYPMWRTVAD